MITQSFAHARITTPDGDTYVDVVVSFGAHEELRFKLDGENRVVKLVNAWSHGQKGYGMTDENGGVWYVKRTGTGCGGCGT